MISQKSGPAEAGPQNSLRRSAFSSVANLPASIRVTNTMRATAAAGAWRYHNRRRDHNWRRHHHAWCRNDGGTTIVHTAIVTVPTAAAVGTTMKARSAAAGDRNCQTGLCLFKRRERHRLGGSNAKEADASYHTEGKKFVHSFLLSFFRYIFAPPTLDCSDRSFARESVARISRLRKLSYIGGAVKNRVVYRRSLSE
jgi:hypothetical protein